jgi:phosphoglycerol transferase MdoB-like AlkP superfamily enzyme
VRNASLLSWKMRGAMSGLGALAWLGVILLQQYPVSSFAVRNSNAFAPGRMAYSYGILLQNALETGKTPGLATQQKLLQAALAHPVQAPLAGLPVWPVRRCVVVVQMESVDWNAVESRIHGELVMPCLYDLKAHSLCWKIRAFHDQCTADMDFAVLTGVPPPSTIIGYTLPNLDYSQSLPALLRAHGYRTAVWHGNDGEFFMRRFSFTRMSFDQFHFREDFRSTPVRRSYWGVRDGELFRLSAEQLQAAPGRMFHLLITLDTHMPFDQIDDSEKEIFPGSHDHAENYFNSLRVLDRNLARYVAALPADTLLVIYGDHSTNVHYGKFEPSRKGHAEFVDCIVYDKSGGIAPGTGPHHDAQGREYRITDVFGHLRHSLMTEQAQPARN